MSLKYLKLFESAFYTRVELTYDGHDGFGQRFRIYRRDRRKRIGDIVIRNKQYLKNIGYDWINEFHIGFKRKYQGKGYFQDAVYEMLNSDDTPIWISDGRVINPDVFKAIDKLDRNIFDVVRIDESGILGHIITLK